MPMIRYNELHGAVFNFCAQLDFGAGGSMKGRVRQEIRQGSEHQFEVHPHQWQITRDIQG